MGTIARQIRRHQDDMAGAAQKFVTSHAAILALQKSCEHTWVFDRQVNDHHEHNWNVTYRCPECATERTDKRRPPVCEACDVSLVRAERSDAEAEAERKKKDNDKSYAIHLNPPLAFRCPKCTKIHILWHRGD